MEKKSKTTIDEIEEILKDSYREKFSIDKTFKKNLDKLVDNTIKAEKLSARENEITSKRGKSNHNLFSTFFRGGRLNTAILTSFLLVILLGGVAFAAVPSIREKIIPTKGKLYINSNPESALVELKGEEYDDYISLGYTPLEKDIKAGNYTLRFSYEDYEEYIREVEVIAGQSENLEITMKRENKAIEKVKEWKTYTNLEQGFEFTYPLNWEFLDSGGDEYDDIKLEITGEESKVIVLRNEDLIEFPSDPVEIMINDISYEGWENLEDWKYIFRDKFTSNEETNYIYLLYYTRNDEEVDIYEFIKSSLKIYEVKNGNDDVSNWREFVDTEIGFKVKYPLEDWIFIEGTVGDHYAEYEIRHIDDEEEKIRIVYSFGYLDELNDYLFDTEMEVNGQNVKRYICIVCEGKLIYEFPNKFYIGYQATNDPDVNAIYDKVRDNFSVLDETKLEEISDYTWMYKFTVPTGWIYNIYYGEDLLSGVEYAALESSDIKLQIFKWEDLRDKWDEYAGSIGLENFEEVRRNSLKVDGREVVRNEIWMYDESGYYMEYMIYTIATLEEEVDFSNPAITIGDNEFVIIVKLPRINCTDVDSIDREDAAIFSILDAIVSSFDGIE